MAEALCKPDYSVGNERLDPLKISRELIVEELYDWLRVQGYVSQAMGNILYSCSFVTATQQI